MTLRLNVKGISQDVDFETGTQTNFVILEGPGLMFRAAIDDEVAQALINAAAGKPPGEVQVPTRYDSSPSGVGELSQEEREQMQAVMAEHEQMRMSEDDNGQSVLDFGGGEVAPAQAVDTSKMSLEELDKLPQEMVMKGKTINSGILDDMGNLRSIPGGGVDAGEVVEQDDDLTDSI